LALKVLALLCEPGTALHEDAGFDASAVFAPVDGALTADHRALDDERAARDTSA